MLRFATLEGANLTATECHGADFSYAVLRSCVLRNTDFSSALLTGTYLQHSALRDCLLEGAEGANPVAA